MSKLLKKDKEKLRKTDYGLPDLKRFPLNDENHVRAAISAFRNCPAERKKELAKRILSKCKLYGIKIDKDSNIYKFIDYKKDESFNYNLYKSDDDVNIIEETDGVEANFHPSNRDIFKVIPSEYFEINKMIDMYSYDHIFIDSDIHLFKDCKEIDDKILQRQKETVSNDDLYISLGDLTQDTISDKARLAEYLLQFNGRNKILVLGNNDVFDKDFYIKECNFNFVIDSFIYKNFVFTHAPLQKKYINDRINIHGHLHNKNTYYNYSYANNICIYNKRQNYRPLSLMKILKKYEDGYYSPDMNYVKKETILMSEIVQFDSNKSKIKIYTMKYEDIMDKFTMSSKLITMGIKLNSTRVIKKELCNLYVLHLLTQKAVKEDRDNKNDMIRANAYILGDFSRGLMFTMEKEPNFVFSEYFKQSEQYPYAIKIDLNLIRNLIKFIKELLFK